MIRCDVLVAGAGPAGSVAARVIARAGRSVLLVDNDAGARGAERHRVGESLPGAARPLLCDVGLLAEFESAGHWMSPGNRSAWGSDVPLDTDNALRDPHGAGWHLDHRRLDEDLRAAASAAWARLRTGRVSSITGTAGRWRARCADGESIQADFLVDATGRRAALARRLGARRVRDTPPVALPAWIPAGAEDRDARTTVEATPDGWWYSSRLPEAARIVVLHTSPANVRALRRHPDEWSRALAATRVTLPAGSPPPPLPETVRDARGAATTPPAGPGWVSVGDASLAFDPISSQGLFHALYTGLRGGQLALGETEPATYANGIARIRAQYTARRALTYAGETRWPASPFWQEQQRRWILITAW